MKAVRQNVLQLSLALGLWVLGVCVAAPWMGGKTPALADSAILFDSMNLSQAVEFFGIVLSKNLLVALLLMGGGLVSAGLFSAVGLLYNGFLLGIVIRQALVAGMNYKELAVGLVFHGPVEIFALSLAGAFGLRGAQVAAGWVRTGTVDFTCLPSARVLRLVAALLLCAALLETLALAALKAGYAF